jgi:crotonobetainyl-CoA:carnitine CoA-transferase CaiB-like acyl-CoA transferase
VQNISLSGVRVLDLSRVLAGPYAAMMLGDLGADVIKVERPGAGDDTRGWGPPFAPDGQSAYFLSCNRNKVSLAANFSSADDQRLLLELIGQADVVIENFLPGSLARYGLDADSLMAQNQRLVWCTISGFGPEATRPGYDFVVQAESGWMAMTGEPAGAPMKAGVAIVDVLTGKDATVGILAALAARDRTALAGRGPLPVSARRVRVSLLDSALASLVNVAQNTLVTGQPARRWGNAHANLVPYQLFPTADRPLVLAVGSDGQWVAAVRALNMEELAEDESLRSNAGRLAQRERVVTAITQRLATQPASHWMARLEAAGVPCGVLREVHEALADSASRANLDVSVLAQTGVLPLWNGIVRLPPPKLGEHSVTVREKQWSLFDNLPILSDGDV